MLALLITLISLDYMNGLDFIHASERMDKSQHWPYFQQTVFLNLSMLANGEGYTFQFCGSDSRLS